MDVGEVVQFYDSDRRFPAWGFGGKTFGGSVSHCFNLNRSPTDSEVTISFIVSICLKTSYASSISLDSICSASCIQLTLSWVG